MSYLDDYLKGKNAKSKSKEAFTALITDLLHDKTIGYEKGRTITSMNMEANAPTQFVPSMIYVFLYNNDKNTKINILNNSFYDRVPLIYCLSCDLNNVTGINFNYMPNDVRAKFLDLISEDGFIDKEKDSGNNEFKVNEKVATTLMTGGASNFIKFMKEQTKIDISSCVRKYNRKNILNSRMIEYDMYDFIPYLNFNDVIRGVNLAKVQKELIDTRNK